jgi:hypothetical protein
MLALANLKQTEKAAIQTDVEAQEEEVDETE